MFCDTTTRYFCSGEQNKSLLFECIPPVGLLCGKTHGEVFS